MKIKIRGYSKKFKGIKKLPAQKTPSRFSAMQSQATAEAKTRKVFGELPEFMGLSQKATGSIAAESLALQTANKKFFGSLRKELSRSRARTATGVKSIRQTKKVPKIAVFKAKQKGAMKAYGIATKKSDKAFMGTMETFTTRQKSSPFKMKGYDVRNKPPPQSVLKQMGLDDREYFNPKTGRNYINTARGDFLDPRERIKKRRK